MGLEGRLGGGGGWDFRGGGVQLFVGGDILVAPLLGGFPPPSLSLSLALTDLPCIIKGVVLVAPPSSWGRH